MSELAERLEEIQRRIAQACRQAGRDRDEVTLIAVSKRQPSDLVEQAYAAGVRDFGENFAQALGARAEEMPEDVRWHMIGHVQSNKAKWVAGRVELLHTLHSARLARALGRLSLVPTPVLIQVNVGAEAQKSGVSRADLAPLLEGLSSQNDVEVKGLMTIPPLDDAPRRWYGMLRQIKEEVAPQFDFDLHCLSMGMSGDFEAAILEGATHIRVGTQVFGPRNAV